MDGRHPRGLLPAATVLWLAGVSACGASSTPKAPPPPPACTLPAPKASALPAAVGGFTQVLHLGTFTVGETATFQVPAGVASVTLVEQGVDTSQAETVEISGQSYGNTVFPNTIAVGGTHIFDVYPDAINPPADPSSLRAYYFTDAVWAGAMTLPNTSSMLASGVPNGSWAVVVSDFAHECGGISNCSLAYAYPASQYDLTVILKQGPAPATGSLAVVFYLLTTEWDSFADPAAAAAASPGVQRMVASLKTLLGRAGVAATATFQDLPASVKAHFATGVNAEDSSPCGDLATLFQNSAPGVTMNLFLVDRITSTSHQGGTTTVGVDGTIPGPASVNGTVQSGAVVSVADVASVTGCGGTVDPMGCGPDEVAYIAAHETGHFLGLYHPTEFDGTLFDPLKDTAQCPCSSCRPAGASLACQAPGGSSTNVYAMTGRDCVASASCGGGDDLMFWVISSASAGTISAEQAQVMRASPVVQ